MSGDPRTYDYASPSRSCDVVMKGGITSGVVYPHAVCELARTYRFVQIGGTSAGAIAAVAAAAAEFGRDRGGFEKLAALPDWVGNGTNLFDLFQPQPGTRRVYGTLTAGLGQRGARRRLAVAAAALRGYWPVAMLGAAPGLALLVLAALGDGGWALRGLALAGGLVLALLGTVLTVGWRLAVRAPRAITANGFGLCSGMPTRRRRGPGPAALTPWLADLVDDLAGLTSEAGPLTFGALRGRGVELAMMTTNLTHRRPHRLPWDDRAFYFDPDEWRRLFPPRIVDWLVAHPPPLGERDPEDSERLRAAMLPRRPLPAADDLPVVVAARMSLSFPLLISAVPLWSIDRTLRRNNEALATDAPHAQEVGGARSGQRRQLAEQVWFSDGGISSNFPVHFFDAPLPLRPTFAIDLDGFHPDYPRSADEARNVYLPTSNVGGLLERWHRFPPDPGTARLVAFAGAIVRTMQNRVDTALARQPGYRDRIVHVHTDPSEGGLNLSMPVPAISALTRRGQAAAALLVERFAATPGEATDTLSWDSHRWTRYRASLTAIAEQLEAVERAWTAETARGERTYAELAGRARDVGPSAYRFSGAGQRELALELTRRLVEAGEAVRAADDELEEQSPRPLPVARIVPRD